MKKIKTALQLQLLLLIAIFALSTMDYNVKAQSVTEKISLHTDREVYLVNEKIWFIANYTDNTLAPGNPLSTVLYLELYNHEQSIVKRKFRIENDFVSGHLEIPPDINSGNYYLRAYTWYQRNAPPESYFTTMLALINPYMSFNEEEAPRADLELIKIKFKTQQNSQQILAAQFHNSSSVSADRILVGNTANNLYNNYSVNKNGLLNVPQNLKYNSDFKAITTNRDTVNLKTKSRELVVFAMIDPKIEAGQLNLTINIDSSYAAENKGKLLKIVIKNIHFETLANTSVATSFGKINLKLPLTKQQNGLFYVSLANNQNQHLYTAPVFIADKSESAVSQNYIAVKQRQHFDILLPADQKCDYLLTGIVKKGTIVSNTNELAYHLTRDHLLLRSFLMTHPVWENNMEQQIQQALRMQIQFVNSEQFTKNLISPDKNTPPEYLPEIRNVNISGVVKNKTTGVPMSDIDLFASVPYHNRQLHHYKTDENGRFIFTLNGVIQEQEVIISHQPTREESEILVSNDFAEQKHEMPYIPLIADTSNLKLMTGLFKNSNIEQAFETLDPTITGKIRKPINPDAAANYTTLLKNYIQLPALADVFNELIPQVRIIRRNKITYFAVYDPETHRVYDNPLVLLDYVPIYDLDNLLKVSADKIERIDLITEMYRMGSYIAPGLIMISSKKQDFARFNLPTGAVFLRYQGTTLQSLPQFPDYTQAGANQAHQPDFRNLLYWKLHTHDIPDSLTLSASDDNSEYEIIIRGKTKTGKFLYSRKNLIIDTKTKFE